MNRTMTQTELNLTTAPSHVVLAAAGKTVFTQHQQNLSYIALCAVRDS
jgi:3'-phosphoadenosine 5'-phosphosulfate (PAPS) 3'-phosphatase